MRFKEGHCKCEQKHLALPVASLDIHINIKSKFYIKHVCFLHLKCTHVRKYLVIQDLDVKLLSLANRRYMGPALCSENYLYMWHVYIAINNNMSHISYLDKIVPAYKGKGISWLYRKNNKIFPIASCHIKSMINTKYWLTFVSYSFTSKLPRSFSASPDTSLILSIKHTSSTLG